LRRAAWFEKMSILNLPRLVFSGYTDWNPDTANNSNAIYDENKAVPIRQYDGQGLPIPWDQFVTWLLTLQSGSSGLTAERRLECLWRSRRRFHER